MSQTWLFVTISISWFVFAILNMVWMRFTFNEKRTINYFTFKRSLEKPKQDAMHYLEFGAVNLMGFGLITNIISQIQIWVYKRKGSHA